MLLKSLEIQGFKTFPDKTRLSFDKGITSVVGPNGSGKSNISDAIRWVLGEQSPKTLRCSKMEDVVFNGTDSRKKVGYAEVTLTIDNQDRALPFDGDSVAVTRRYYRSGDSEYLINKAAVRLKDIHELFMDTGLGRDGYSMISQGKIDSIVASKSEDRREIFEEASGISRYRYRKIEAERKLNQTEENLLRLRDILNELESRVEPLEKQAAKAKSYLEYAKEKEGLEIALWLNTLEQSSKILREQEDKIAVANSQHEQAVKALADIEKETEEIYNATGAFSSKMDEIRRINADLEKQISEIRAKISVEENNIKHNLSSIERLNNDLLNIDKVCENIRKENEEKKQRIADYKKTLEEKREEFNNVTFLLSGLVEDDGKNSALLNEYNTTLTRLNIELANARAAKMTATASISDMSLRLANIERSLYAKIKLLDEQKDALKDFQAMSKEAAENFTNQTNAVKGYELKLLQKQKKRDEIKAQGDKLTLDINGIKRNISFLENLEKNLEGFAQSVKVVVKESRSGVLHGIHGPVSRVIKVPVEYAVAIETALGAAMQNIVTETEDDAKKAIAFLKRKDAGRATFLPLSTIRGNVLQEKGLDNCNGFVGVASNLCSCDEKYKGILNSLLGRICIAENLDFAVEIAKKYSYRFRVVTLDGQVVNAGGSLTGGSLNKKTGLLSRVGEIEKAKKELAMLEDKIENARSQYIQAQSECGRVQAELEQSRTALAQIQEEKFRTEAACKSAQEQIESLKISVKELEDEKSEIQTKSEELKTSLEKAEQELARVEKEISAVQEKIDTLSGELAEKSDKREALTSELQDIKLEMLALEKDIGALEAEIEQAESSSVNQNLKRKEILDEIEQVKLQNKQIEELIYSYNAEEMKFRRTVAANNERMTELTAERAKLEKRSTELRQQERDRSSEREKIGQELARLEERKNNLNKQYDDIIKKLWDEYELTPRQAQEKAAEIENINAAQKRLAELKSKIKSLGSVNVAAIDEYKEVSERYEFMKTQVGDVEKSKKEILSLIGDLTKQMKEIFIERFGLINKNFSETFKELFGGGNASLSLTNEDDILNSGIDIKCHPPGKVVSHLELLSGGERAFVAIALYFAIMKVSPAPFCVMDEIEAALDEVNVDRFARYLRKMNDNTQFILITHRRGTMEEADVLYGVTMQDEGISKLLELHSSEVAASFTNLR